MALPILEYKLLYVVSSKDNEKYLKLQKLLENQTLVDTLKKNNINLVENIVHDKNVFSINFYNIDMRLIQTFDDVNDQIINQIIDIINQLSTDKTKSGPSQSQIGGKKDFKSKYYKYKNKYNNIKKIITRLY